MKNVMALEGNGVSPIGLGAYSTLSLLLGSFAALGMATAARAQEATYTPQIPQERLLTSPGQVDVRGGRYVYDETDISAGAPGSPAQLSLKRVTDNGDIMRKERFAPFSHNWDIMITETKIKYTVVGDYHKLSPDGLQISVIGNGVGASFRIEGDSLNYTAVASAQPGWIERMGTNSDYYYIYTSGDGAKITFMPFTTPGCSQGREKCAYASKVEKPDGTIYTLSYDSVAVGADPLRLRSVVANTGYALMLEYYPSSNSNNLIKKGCIISLYRQAMPSSGICPSDALSATYQYSNNLMTEATRGDGRVSRFTNTFRDLNTDYEIAFFNGTDAQPFLTNRYEMGPFPAESNYRVVKSQLFGDGMEITYRYIPMATGEASETLIGGGYSYAGSSVSLYYGRYKFPQSNDESWYLTSAPERVTDELDRVTTTNFCVPFGSYGGCNVSPPQEITQPDGVRIKLAYDSHYNLIEKRTIAAPGSPLADLVEQAHYNCNKENAAFCTKPTYTIDANDNRWDYEYFAHGGAKSTLGPVVGGVRPLTLSTYLQKSASLKNAAGVLIATSPVWLVDTITQCRTTNLPDNSGCAPGDAVVTRYEYGAAGTENALRVMGVTVTADGVTQRSCYGYDSWGRKLSETQPMANRGNCS